MRILHTSDWHLGATLEQASLENEQARFLDWLYETLRDAEVDCLIVAGDVFDSTQAPARAQGLYYRFLHRCQDLPALKKIVVVGGNHDSASQLDAPAPVLRELSVDVVGGLSSDPAQWERALIPVPDATGTPQAVIVATPYIHESRLGVGRIAGEGIAPDLARSFYDAFENFYTELARRARERFGDLPLVGVAHLTCMPAAQKLRDDDFKTDLHQIGALGALPPSIFCEDYDYVALGHIHRGFAVESGRIWYSGTPVPIRFNEAQTPRQVLLVDVGEEVVIDRRDVPEFRALITYRDTPEELEKLVRKRTWDAPYPPYVAIESIVDVTRPGTLERLRDAIEEAFEPGERPRIIAFREVLHANREHLAIGEQEPIPLETVTPAYLFEQLYRSAHEGQPPPPEITATFADLLPRDDAPLELASPEQQTLNSLLEET
ncbi:exonuclease subunit SbcD [Lujinxingia vulgaris]|uniref:Nuclease SbcCD subunit D n=1 Tax=Lujinxingia vulgaris TaxID=2600176 RepID=A0A5C6X803_9DELT|nr:exonuclease subunit SbcD [Lujinxingia vulgaris]TXD36400.1 exonuclease subunit SbcD [Lujinxingia vulgaris]